MACTRLLAIVAFAVPLLAACGGGGGGGDAGVSAGAAPPLPTVPAPPPPPSQNPRQFVDATASSGIFYYIGYRSVPWHTDVSRIATNGAAAGDYDNDGDIDLFITRGDIGASLLYRNNGFGVFTEVAESAGLAWSANATENYRHSGPTFADMDGDGDLDLFVGGLFGDPSKIYRNEGAVGGFGFTDVTEDSGLGNLTKPHNISAAFGDYDLDGDLDLFVTHWGSYYPVEGPGDTQNLWRNDTSDGTIRFTSVSESAGISPSIVTLPDPKAVRQEADWTFSASFARINDDLYPDIVVAADFNNSQVFLNQGDGTFVNATDVSVIIDYNGMGSAVGDYDNDGDLDWFVTAIGTSNGELLNDIGTLGNRLYRNTQGDPGASGVFEDVTDAAGVADGGWGWAACFLDLNNDGNLDIYHTNGWANPIPADYSRAFISNGAGAFAESAAALGLDDDYDGRGVVCADFDNDGDTDVFLLHRGWPNSAALWRNDADTNNYLTVRLKGLAPNTEASGARIYATIGGQTQMREIIIGSNFVSQNPAVQVFGLGGASQVDELRVEWPDGSETNLGPVAAGQTVEIEQPVT
jgi:hypothetical protein